MVWDVIIRAFLQSFHYCFVVSLCRQQNDGNTRCVRIFLDHSAKLVTPYAGHHDVGEDDVRIFIGETGDSFVSVGNINHPIEVFKGLAEVVTESFVVFYNEQCIPVVRIFSFCPFRGCYYPMCRQGVRGMIRATRVWLRWWFAAMLR